MGIWRGENLALSGTESGESWDLCKATTSSSERIQASEVKMWQSKKQPNKKIQIFV